MITPKSKAIIHVKAEVFLGVAAPHFGQVFALVLTSSPHSLHFTNAIQFSLVRFTHNARHKRRELASVRRPKGANLMAWLCVA
jgi:hypothetical protein